MNGPTMQVIGITWHATVVDEDKFDSNAQARH